MVGDLQSLGLGKHVDATLAQHKDEHAQKVNSAQQERQQGREERKQKAENLGTRLAQAIEAVGKWKQQGTITSVTPKELDNGTQMYVHLQSIGTFEEAVNQVCSPKYVNEGPAFQQYSGKILDEKAVSEVKLGYGVVVNISLSSKDEDFDVETQHQVHVGNLIDPESILVPEDEQNGEKQYSVIGQGDSRYMSIMNLINECFGSEHQIISEDLDNIS